MSNGVIGWLERFIAYHQLVDMSLLPYLWQAILFAILVFMMLGAPAVQAAGRVSMDILVLMIISVHAVPIQISNILPSKTYMYDDYTLLRDVLRSQAPHHSPLSWVFL